MSKIYNYTVSIAPKVKEPVSSANTFNIGMIRCDVQAESAIDACQKVENYFSTCFGKAYTTDNIYRWDNVEDEEDI